MEKDGKIRLHFASKYARLCNRDANRNKIQIDSKKISILVIKSNTMFQQQALYATVGGMTKSGGLMKDM